MQAEVRGPDGSKQVIVFPPNDHIGRVVQSSGAYYEQDLLTAIRDLGITGAYLDIGAHCGNHTVFFATHCRASEVCAVEPSPETYDLLRQTLKVNDIHAVAMHGGVHPSWRWVSSVEGSWQPPASDPTRTNTGTRHIKQGRPGDVPAWTLDELGLPFERVGLIKIDTEGLGAEVLASGARLIERDQPIIVVEAATKPEQRSVAGVLGRWNYLNVGRFCRTPTWLWRP